MKDNLSSIPDNLKEQYERVMGWQPPAKSPSSEVSLQVQKIGRYREQMKNLPKVSYLQHLRGVRTWKKALAKRAHRGWALTPPVWRNWKKALAISLLLLILLPSLTYLSLRRPQGAEAAWMDDNWGYRQRVDITNSGSAQTDFQVAITLNTSALITAGKMQSDCDDIRITDVNGKVLAHWVESRINTCNTTTTAIWVKVPSISTTGTTLYLYYGNPSASNTQNGDNVFIFFDDFSSNLNKWTIEKCTSSEIYIESGYLKLNTTSHCSLGSSTSYSNFTDGIIETKYYLGDANAIAEIAFRGNYGSNIGYKGRWDPRGGQGIGYLKPAYSSWNFWTGSGPNGTAVPSAQWRSGKMAVSGTTDFRIWDNTTLFTSSGDTTYQSAGQISLQQHNGTYALYDDVIVRKYAATEPSVGSPTNEEKSVGPVAYWSFDSGYGTVAQDATSNNNDGTISGATWQSEDQCISGKCLLFNGTSDLVDAGNGNSVSFGTGSFSISGWTRTSNTSNYKTIVSKGTSNAGATARYYMRIEATTGKFHTSIADGTNEANISGIKTGLHDGNWHHLVIVVDRSSQMMKTYIDGLQDDSVSTSLVGNINSSQSLRIGILGTQGYYFSGFIDDVKIYNYARSAAQIKADFLRGSTSKGSSAVLGGRTSQGDFLSQGLVGYWKMDETSSPAADSSGNGNSGTWNGTADDASGKFGNGISLDGDSDYVSISDSNSLDITPNLTISAWVKLDTVSANYQNFVAKRGVSGSPSNYLLRTGGSNHSDPDEVQFGYYTDSYRIVGTTNANLTTGTWYHIVATHNSSGEKIYINGTEYSAVWRWGSSSATLVTDNQTLAIGRGGDYPGEYTDGTIDDVRIYNRSLSPKEVRDLYNWAAGPYVYLSFDEGTGTAINDRSGNGYSGSWNGTGSHWSSGKYGKSGNFNGTSDYVSFSSLPKPTNLPITIEFWTKPSTATPVGIFDSAPGQQYVLRNYASGEVEWWPDTPQLSLGLTASTWTHLVFIYNYSGGNQTIEWYKNGVKQTTASAAGAGTWAWTTFILGNINGGGAGWYSGDLDEFKIYNYARTPKQIVEDMNAGHPAPGSPVGSQVGYWRFDEGYGTTAQDSSPQNNDGTINNATWTNNGKFGKALSFDGSGDDVSLNVNSWIRNAEYITITGWYYHNADTNGAPWGIMTNTAANEGDGFWWHIKYGGSTLYLRTEDNVHGESGGTGTPFVSTGNWYHLATIVGTNKFDVYVNGKLYWAWTPDNGFSWSSINSDTAYLLIGRSYYNDSTAVNGRLDEVKIYNSALTEDEIKLDYNRGSAMVMGSTSTDSSGNPGDNSSSREYCVPGDTGTCNPPVAEWKMDELTGNYAQDTSGNGNTGTITIGGSGSQTTVAQAWKNGVYGKVGASLNFDGTDDYVVSSSNPSTSQVFTTTFWFKTPTPSTNMYLLDRGGNIHWFELISSKLRSGTSASNYSDSTTTIQANTWYHAAMVYDGTTIKQYLNGVQQFSIAGGNVTPSGLQLARYYGGGTYFNGQIDHVKIFNYARTPAQIAWDYNRGGPVGLWRFDECQGINAYDTSGNGNNGTITIGASGSQTSAGTCSTSGTAWYNGATGKYSASLNFDGTDDYVRVADTSYLDAMKTAITISAWAYRNANQSGWRALVTREKDTGGDNHYHFSFYDNQYRFYISTTGGTALVTGSTAPNTTWLHLVATYDGTNVRYYVNGVRQTNMDATNSGTFTDDDNPILIGADTNNHESTYEEFFNGQIDDVKIFNYALTPLQIKNLFNEGSAVRFGPSEGSP